MASCWHGYVTEVHLLLGLLFVCFSYKYVANANCFTYLHRSLTQLAIYKYGSMYSWQLRKGNCNNIWHLKKIACVKNRCRSSEQPHWYMRLHASRLGTSLLAELSVLIRKGKIMYTHNFAMNNFQATYFLITALMNYIIPTISEINVNLFHIAIT